AVGALCRLRRSAVRLLGGPLNPLRARRRPGRARHGARPVHRGRAHHRARDVPARASRGPGRRPRRHLPHHLRRRAHPPDAVGAAGPVAVARRSAPALGPARDRAMTRLSVSGITKRFGGITANRDVSFDVAPGELVGIIGPNGSGKSTLFEVISGFYRPDAGEARLLSGPLTRPSPDRVCRPAGARTVPQLRPFPFLTLY